MLRKDLKPGDVFRYRDTPNTTWYVFPREGFISPEWLTSNETSSLSCSEDKVELVEKSIPETPLVTSPIHYTTTDVEPINAIEAWGLGFRLANVVKYVARAGKKPGVDAKQDLLKARAYLSREIAALEGRHAWE